MVKIDRSKGKIPSLLEMQKVVPKSRAQEPMRAIKKNNNAAPEFLWGTVT